ncbi:MAG: CoA transferase [Deltaproteobacteria bacterium]|nr:CoA transferase [Deltaproteobacteria bacterium]
MANSILSSGGINPGKYGLSLNLSAPGAREVAMRLVNWADVVIENFSPKGNACPEWQNLNADR